MDIKTIGKEIAYVGQGIAFPRIVEISTEAGEGAPVALIFTVVYSEAESKYVLRQVAIGSSDSAAEITGQLIRSVQFQEILLKGLSQLKFLDLNSHSFSQVPALKYRPAKRDEIIKQGPTKQSLEAVALLYRIAEVLNANQGKHVEGILNIPYATAANWISRARKQGAFESIADISKVFPKAKELQENIKPDSFVS